MPDLLKLSAIVLATVLAAGPVNASEYQRVLDVEAAVAAIATATSIELSYAAVEALGFGFVPPAQASATPDPAQPNGSAVRLPSADALARYPGLAGFLALNSATGVMVISAGTTIALRPGDHLELSMPLVVAGTLLSDGASILSTDASAAILAVDDGRIELADTLVSRLGDATTPSLVIAGTASATIRDSIIRSSGAVALLGSGDVAVERTMFDHPPGVAITVDGSTHGTLRGNVVIAGGGDGILVRSSSGAVDIASNIVVSGAAAGIRVDSSAGGLSLVGNLVAANDGPALAFAGTTCILVKGNWLVANGGDGIAIKGSFGATVSGNLIASNGGAGVRIGNQPLMAALALTDNEIAGNKVGVTGTDPTPILLAGNALGGQSPKLFGGAYSGFASSYLKARGNDFTLAGGTMGIPAISVCAGGTSL